MCVSVAVSVFLNRCMSASDSISSYMRLLCVPRADTPLRSTVFLSLAGLTVRLYMYLIVVFSLLFYLLVSSLVRLWVWQFVYVGLLVFMCAYRSVFLCLYCLMVSVRCCFSYLFVCLLPCVSPCVCLCVCLSACMSACISECLSVWLPTSADQYIIIGKVSSIHVGLESSSTPLFPRACGSAMHRFCFCLCFYCWCFCWCFTSSVAAFASAAASSVVSSAASASTAPSSSVSTASSASAASAAVAICSRVFHYGSKRHLSLEISYFAITIRTSVLLNLFKLWRNYTLLGQPLSTPCTYIHA